MRKKYSSNEKRKKEYAKQVGIELMQKCSKNGWNKIGVVSSNKYGIFKSDIIQQLEMIIKNKIILVELSMFEDRGTLLEVALTCDAVLLVERYHYSTFTRFEELIKLLRQNNISIAGIVAHK